MMKKVVSIMLVTSMTLSLTAHSFAANFNDIAGHWAEKQISAAADLGIVAGDASGSFRPNDYITRAEMTTIVNKAFGFTEQGTISFSDVKSSDWFYGQIAIAFKAGYISGDASGTMRPKDPIVRQEVAVIFAKVLGLEANASAASSFADSKDIASWATGAVGAVFSEGVMTGRPNNMLAPKDKITRAETVSLVMRALGETVDNDTVTPTTAPVATPEPTYNPDTTTVISTATYGPETGTETIEKDVVVKTASTLKNLVIKGDLTIDAASATLDNVTVDGTVHLTKASSSVTTKSALNKVSVDADAVKFTVSNSATIKDLTVTEKGTNSTITLNADTKVELFTANAKCTVNGSGKVSQANLTVANVTMTNDPSSYVTGSQKAIKPTTSGGGGGGGGGTVTTPTPTVKPTANPVVVEQKVQELKNSIEIPSDPTQEVVVKNPEAATNAIAEIAHALDSSVTVRSGDSYANAYSDTFANAVNENSTLKNLFTKTDTKTQAEDDIIAESSVAMINVVNKTADQLASLLNSSVGLDLENPASAAQMSSVYNNVVKAETAKISDANVAADLNQFAKATVYTMIDENADALNALKANGGTVTAAAVMDILFGLAK